MTISDFLTVADVAARIRVPAKRQLLLDMSRDAAARLGISAEDVSSGLIKREDLGSTGMGGGVAIPHVRLQAVKRPFGMLATLRPAIDFDAIDHQPVDIVFLLLLPAPPETDQMAALAAVARRMKAPGMLKQLRAAKTPAELYTAITATEP